MASPPLVPRCGRGAGTETERQLRQTRAPGTERNPDEPSESSSCPVRQPLGKAARCGALSAFSAVFTALSQILQLLAVSLEGLRELKTTPSKSVS